MHWLAKLVVAAVVLAASAQSLRADDWPQFRGPAGTGISDESDAPVTWDANTNVKWRAPLAAPSNSSPIVSRGRVFVTVATEGGRQRSLHCYDRRNGKLLWTRAVEFSGEEPTHNTNPHASPTPAADGQRVVAWYSSAGLYCYDFDGRPLWSRDLGEFVHVWGYAASPIFFRGSVILNCGPGKRTFVTALDARTGKTLWQTDEPGGDSGLVKKNPDDKNPPWIGSWSTPVVATIDGQALILLGMPGHVQAYGPKTGRIVWTCDGLSELVYASVMLGDGLAVAMSGYHGSMIGLRLGGAGNVTEQNVLWQAKIGNPQRIGTGVILQGNLFITDEKGIAECIDVASGEKRWRARLPGGSVWGSIVSAAGRLYVTSQSGETNVFGPNPRELEVLSVNALGEPSNATPAVSDGEIFLRTDAALYCIRED